jgi:tRNA-dihydrouridine synthase
MPTVDNSSVGMIKASQQANDVLAEGKAIVVFLAREFLRDPHFFSCTLRKNLATQGSPRVAIDAGTHIETPSGFSRARVIQAIILFFGIGRTLCDISIAIVSVDRKQIELF